MSAWAMHYLAPLRRVPVEQSHEGYHSGPKELLDEADVKRKPLK